MTYSIHTHVVDADVIKYDIITAGGVKKHAKRIAGNCVITLFPHVSVNPLR
jgi:hypothetical protein